MTGQILKGIGGFYTVRTEGGDYVCKPRGILRKQGISPLVGDFVSISLQPESEGTIDEILPRKNSFVRPPLANIELLVLVVSLTSPPPNLPLLDTLIAVAECKGIEPIICFNKNDLSDDPLIDRIYSGSGFITIVTSAVTGAGVDELAGHISGKFSAFTGLSGVGKSSLLNLLDENIDAAVGDISAKLERGRHTTRHVELFSLKGGGFVADTPGFSSVDVLRLESIRKEELSHCFREFRQYLEKCRFDDCSHTAEPGCAVSLAVEQGKISQSRYKSYCEIYQDLKKIKEWER